MFIGVIVRSGLSTALTELFAGNFITTLIPQTVSAVTVTVATTSSTTTTTTTTPTTVPTAAQVPITSSACGSKSRHAENIRLRVVGGTVANAHEWPWQVCSVFCKSHLGKTSFLLHFCTVKPATRDL